VVVVVVDPALSDVIVNTITPIAPARKRPTTSSPIAICSKHGLTLDEEEPALGTLLAARDELGLIATLAEAAQRGTDFDLADLVPVLERVARSLDVVHELIVRAPKEEATGEPLAQ
jgi:hypothetical protein